MRAARNPRAADIYRIDMTTDLSDVDIIMGRGEKRLFHAIRQAIDTYRPAAVFVYSTCVPAISALINHVVHLKNVLCYVDSNWRRLHGVLPPVCL